MLVGRVDQENVERWFPLLQTGGGCNACSAGADNNNIMRFHGLLP